MNYQKDGLSVSVRMQIASLLNSHNQLPTKYTASRIKHSDSSYFPIVFKDKVIGSVAITRHNFLLTEIKHLVVHPSARKIGLGKKLIEIAESKINTPLAYATIRESNFASIKSFTSKGFKTVSKINNKSQRLLFLIKEL